MLDSYVAQELQEVEHHSLVGAEDHRVKEGQGALVLRVLQEEVKAQIDHVEEDTSSLEGGSNHEVEVLLNPSLGLAWGP